MTNDELIELVLRSLPYPDHIRDIDTTAAKNAIRFTWRRHRYNVDEKGRVSEIEKKGNTSFESGGDRALLMEHLLKKTNVLRQV